MQKYAVDALWWICLYYIHVNSSSVFKEQHLGLSFPQSQPPTWHTSQLTLQWAVHPDFQHFWGRGVSRDFWGLRQKDPRGARLQTKLNSNKLMLHDRHSSLQPNFKKIESKESNRMVPHLGISDHGVDAASCTKTAIEFRGVFTKLLFLWISHSWGGGGLF